MLQTSAENDSSDIGMESCPAELSCRVLDMEAATSGRKANKPLMEKRRRARINKSLLELKSMLMESMNKKQTPGHSKWEKADILEMTVQYVQCLRNQQQATKGDPLSIGQFIAGFSECIRQVQKSDGLFTLDDEDHGNVDHCSTVRVVKQRLIDSLLTHLKNFSDDATQGLRTDARHQSEDILAPRNDTRNQQQQSALSQLKTIDGRPSLLNKSPSLVGEHSPTGSSLSPKSTVGELSSSPGLDSNCTLPAGDLTPTMDGHGYTDTLGHNNSDDEKQRFMHQSSRFFPLIFPPSSDETQEACSNDVVAAASLLKQFHDSFNTRPTQTAGFWRPW